MNVVPLDSYDDVSRIAARHVARRLIEKPDSALALPSGRTPIGLYRRLVELYDAGLVSFAECVCFGLDEYLGLAPDDPQSFHRFLHDQLFDQVDLKPDRIYTLNGATANPDAECAAFERAIARHPLDLVVLGIGPNGHIAFNEPGSDWGSRTRVVHLDEATLESVRDSFDAADVPQRGLTMGIQTIMHADEILLLASGPHKASPVRGMLSEPISRDIPASVLRLHPRATLYADREALDQWDAGPEPIDL